MAALVSSLKRNENNLTTAFIGYKYHCNVPTPQSVRDKIGHYHCVFSLATDGW